MTTPVYRVTIEGPPAGRERIVNLVAAQLQVLGCKAIHINNGTEKPSPVKADAEIIVKALSGQ